MSWFFGSCSGLIRFLRQWESVEKQSAFLPPNATTQCSSWSRASFYRNLLVSLPMAVTAVIYAQRSRRRNVQLPHAQHPVMLICKAKEALCRFVYVCVDGQNFQTSVLDDGTASALRRVLERCGNRFASNLLEGGCYNSKSAETFYLPSQVALRCRSVTSTVKYFTTTELLRYGASWWKCFYCLLARLLWLA